MAVTVYGRVLLEPEDARHFRLAEEVRVVGHRGDVWVIPAGFQTDGASIPAVFRWLVSAFGAHTLAALVHDLLCRIAAFLIPSTSVRALAEGMVDRRDAVMPLYVTRRDADGVFRSLLREAGVDPALCWLMWAAVRLGGGFKGGMSLKEAGQFAACIPAGLIVAVLTLPPLLGRCLMRVVGYAWRP